MDRAQKWGLAPALPIAGLPVDSGKGSFVASSLLLSIFRSRITGLRRLTGGFHDCGVVVLGENDRTLETTARARPPALQSDDQYFGMVRSIRSAQAVIPPVRFFTFVKPACRRNCTAFALRPPI